MRQPLRPQKAYEGSEIKVVFSQHVTEGWVEEKFKIRYHGHSNKNVLVILVLYFFFTFDIRGCGGPPCRPGHCAASVVFCITARAGNQFFWCLSALRAHTKSPIQN
jgi:hypothetical protein